MRRLTWVAAATACVLAIGACSKQAEPPEKFNEVIFHGQMSLPPVPLERHNVDGLPPVSAARFVKKIDGAVTGKIEDLGPLTPGGAVAKAPAAIQLNDGDPKALMEQFVGFIAEQNLDGVAAAVVLDQQETLQKMAAAMKTLSANVKRLHDAMAKDNAELAKKFEPDEKGLILLEATDPPGTPPIPLMVAIRPAAGGVASVGEVEVDPADANRATVTVTAVQDNAEVKIELVAADGKWRVRLPGFPTGEAAEPFVKAVNAAVEAFGAVAGRVENGEIPADGVMNELMTAIQAAIAKRADGEKPAEPEPAAEGETPAPEPAADPNAPAPEPTGGPPSEPGPAPEPGQPQASDDRPERSRSGRDVNNEQPTAEELLTRQ
jgi:hypothetical protein